MDDLIRRQDAIDALGERPYLWTGGDYELGCVNQYDLDKLAIETVPSAQQWIPCTERLPEEPCIACDKFGQIFIPDGTVEIDDKCYNARKFNFNPKEFLRGEIVKMAGGKTVRILPNEIIAWMPLPECYRGEKDGE